MLQNLPGLCKQPKHITKQIVHKIKENCFKICRRYLKILQNYARCIKPRGQVSLKPILHQSRTAHRARRNTCKLSQPMDATVQHCPATVPAVTGIDRPKLGQRRSSGLTVHTTDEARTALRLSKLRSIKILYTLTMIYDSLYI